MKIGDVEESIINKIKWYVSDEDELKDIVLNSDSYSVKKEALIKIKKPEFIEEIAINLVDSEYVNLRHRCLQKCDNDKVPKLILINYWNAKNFEYEEMKILKHCVKRVDDETIIFKLIQNDRLFCILWHENFAKFFRSCLEKLRSRDKLKKVVDQLKEEYDEYENDVFARDLLSGLLINAKERLESISPSVDFILNDE